MDTSEDDSCVSFDYFGSAPYPWRFPLSISAFSGYGVVDFKRELWLHEEIGRSCASLNKWMLIDICHRGMFGVVRRATLRRRRRMKARYVAVKVQLVTSKSE